MLNKEENELALPVLLEFLANMGLDLPGVLDTVEVVGAGLVSDSSPGGLAMLVDVPLPP